VVSSEKEGNSAREGTFRETLAMVQSVSTGVVRRTMARKVGQIGSNTGSQGGGKATERNKTLATWKESLHDRSGGRWKKGQVNLKMGLILKTSALLLTSIEWGCRNLGTAKQSRAAGKWATLST